MRERRERERQREGDRQRERGREREREREGEVRGQRRTLRHKPFRFVSTLSLSSLIGDMEDLEGVAQTFEHAASKLVKDVRAAFVDANSGKNVLQLAQQQVVAFVSAVDWTVSERLRSVPFSRAEKTGHL